MSNTKNLIFDLGNVLYDIDFVKMYDAFDQFMKLLESPLELPKIINQVNTKGFWGDSRA